MVIHPRKEIGNPHKIPYSTRTEGKKTPGRSWILLPLFRMSCGKWRGDFSLQSLDQKKLSRSDRLVLTKPPLKPALPLISSARSTLRRLLPQCTVCRRSKMLLYHTTRARRARDRRRRRRKTLSIQRLRVTEREPIFLCAIVHSLLLLLL